MTAPAEIPRIFHWIWLGSDEMPAQHRQWMRSWRERHPTWEFRLWADRALPRLRNQAAYDVASSYAQKADIARYEILYLYGGVYLDTDMECLRAIDTLLAGSQAFAGWESSGFIGNAILGCRPEHPWLARITEELPGSMRKYGGPVDQTGPGLVTRCTSKRKDVRLYDCDVLYGERGSVRVTSETYAIHHYASSWVADAHAELRRVVAEAFACNVPGDARYAVLDAEVGVATNQHPLGQPFYDTTSNGLPGTGDEVVRQLHALLADGVRFLVVTIDCFWWLDHYSDFAVELRRYSRLIVEDSLFQLYAFIGQPIPGQELSRGDTGVREEVGKPQLTSDDS